MQEPLIDFLKSFGWNDIPAWLGLLISALNVIVIIVIAIIVRGLIEKALRIAHTRLRARMSGVEERKRIDTLDRIFGYITSVVIAVITIMVVLSELGISIAPFLATAGVVGIAISFGAQSLVKDYFTGFVMLIENQIRQGDFVEVANKSGTVEEVTLRYVRLRDGEGAVHFVPNSSITTVSNHSRDFAFAVVDVGVGYDANLGRTYEVIRQVGRELRSDPKISNKTLDDIEVLGVTQLADSAVTVRVRMKVVAMEQWGIKREILARLKLAFEQAGIDIPFPQRVVRIANPAIPG